MNKKVTLYNVMFPLWLLMLFPQTWILVLPINFLVDSLVILIAGKIRKLNNVMECYKKSILKTFLFGFAADALGALVLLIPEILPNKWFENVALNNIRNALIVNPFTNIFAFMYASFAIIVSMFFIYNFNLKFVFEKLDMSDKDKKFMSLALTFITAPYTFLIPTAWLY